MCVSTNHAWIDALCLFCRARFVKARARRGHMQDTSGSVAIDRRTLPVIDRSLPGLVFHEHVAAPARQQRMQQYMIYRAGMVYLIKSKYRTAHYASLCNLQKVPLSCHGRVKVKRKKKDRRQAHMRGPCCISVFTARPDV